MRRSNAEHRRIYDAISKGSHQRAKAQAEDHIKAGRQRLLALADDTAPGRPVQAFASRRMDPGS